jgi:serine/threonine protein phosphatase PrpC
MAPEQGMYTIAFGFAREKGPVRAENQDQICNFQSSIYGQVFLIADGMGGHEGGAIAANMAITGFKQHFLTVSNQLSLRDSMIEAARLTNLDIYEKSNEKNGGPHALRMGSTLVLCVLAGNVYTLANVGDSRCYSFRDEVLTKLTNDHTAVQKMVDTGILSPEEARNHPESSVLTRAFGQRPDIEMDVYAARSLEEGEMLLLCSDGLYGFVSETAIVDGLRRNHDPQMAADALAQLALAAGGHDNISIYVIRVAPGGSKIPTAPELPIEPEPVSSALPIAAPAAESVLPDTLAQTPIRQASGKSMRRVIAGVLLLSAVLAVFSATLYLRPEVLPVEWRGKLNSWGIRIPQLVGHQNIAQEKSPNSDGAVPVPVIEVSSQAPSPAPPASPAESGSVPLKIILAHPPSTDAAFMTVFTDIRNRLRTEGYAVTPVEKPVRADNVWRAAIPDPSSFAPKQPYVSAVFPEGRQAEAGRICQIAGCAGNASREIASDDRQMFDKNFGPAPMVVFVHPAGRAENKQAASAENKAKTAETPEE